LERHGDALVAVYEGACPSCARQRRFEFELVAEIPPRASFGGARASEIIDAGQFLLVADDAARAVPSDVSRLGAAEREDAAPLMRRAVAALEEVLKFIPPQTDRVPAEALFSASGRELYLAEPGRFRKARLEAVLGVYRTFVAELT
jgi:hypothetical protein